VNVALMPAQLQHEWDLYHATWFTLMGVGGGIFLLARLLRIERRLGVWLGLPVVDLISFVVIGIGGLVLVWSLGRPLRMLRAVLKPGTSWISRGAIADFIFVAVGGLLVLPGLTIGGATPFAGLPWDPWATTTTGKVLEVVGLLSSAVATAYGEDGLPEGTITVTFNGSGGQSFGAWLAKGIDFTLWGDANDYAGKGLSGGVLTVRPPDGSPFVAEDNVIVGNTVLYGATSGRAFFRGLAGERFAVRNSGAVAVVEGVGDHGCEYMTGGRVVVLGETGRNFAAGMSGGIAYVLDEAGVFASRCNTDLVELEEPTAADLAEVRALVDEHGRRTGSALSERLLARWDEQPPAFVKVMPRDYKKALARLAEAKVAV